MTHKKNLSFSIKQVSKSIEVVFNEQVSVEKVQLEQVL